MNVVRAKDESTSIKEVKAYLTTVQDLLIDSEMAIDESYEKGSEVIDKLEEMLDILDEIHGAGGPLYEDMSDED